MMKIISYIVMMILLCSIAIAVELEDGDYIKRGQSKELIFSCFNSGGPCSSSAECNLTIQYPDSSFYINEFVLEPISGVNHKFNYTVKAENTLGVYSGLFVCKDGIFSNYQEFKFEVNDSGAEENRLYLIIATAIIAVLLFYIAFKLDNTYFILQLILVLFGFLFLLLIPISLVTYSSMNRLYSLFIGFFIVFLTYVFIHFMYYMLEYFGLIVPRNKGGKGG